MKSICVYCGASNGNAAYFADAARSLAQQLVDRDLHVVYGGGNIGLMGTLANEVMRLGGDVTGVIPQRLMDMEVGHMTLTRLHVVKDMHERKALMAQLSDGFIAMPGGIGTLEELFEMLTWHQLGFHKKPVGVFNVNGFFDGLLSFLQFQVERGFLNPQHHALLHQSRDAGELIQQLQNFTPT